MTTAEFRDALIAEVGVEIVSGLDNILEQFNWDLKEMIETRNEDLISYMKKKYTLNTRRLYCTRISRVVGSVTNRKNFANEDEYAEYHSMWSQIRKEINSDEPEIEGGAEDAGAAGVGVKVKKSKKSATVAVAAAKTGKKNKKIVNVACVVPKGTGETAVVKAAADALLIVCKKVIGELLNSEDRKDQIIMYLIGQLEARATTVAA